MSLIGKVCTRGVWDETVPGIKFDVNGVSNYANLHDTMVKAYPRGEIGKSDWLSIVKKMKRQGHGKKYDCIIGVSGGTDSCFLLHLSKEYGLRPLAVNLDNGFYSDIAVKNIKRVTSALNIDLVTYVIDYEEVKAVLRSYIKASLPWVDGPTDLAIKATLYKIANKEGIKNILNGSDFHSEGKQPIEWTYSDSKQMLFLLKKYESKILKTFPYYSFIGLFYYGYINKIKMHRPYYYIDYQKKEAQKILKNLYGWEYYGGHHHENSFTKFVIAYWMPEKFGIDKRKITLSAQVLSGEMTREEALNILELPPYSPEIVEKDVEFIVKKLGFTSSEFNDIFSLPNKYFYNYPSFLPLIEKFMKIFCYFVKKTLPLIPPFFFEKTVRNEENANIH